MTVVRVFGNGFLSPFDTVAMSEAYDRALPYELVRAIMRVESSSTPQAARYEPAFFKKYVEHADIRRDEYPKACTLETERMFRATSWGPMQVMGQVAREHGFRGWLTELSDPAIGISLGCAVLARFRDKFLSFGWDAVCSAYNGGRGAVIGPGVFRNPQYPAKVLLALGGKWPELPPHAA